VVLFILLSLAHTFLLYLHTIALVAEKMVLMKPTLCSTYQHKYRPLFYLLSILFHLFTITYRLLMVVTVFSPFHIFHGMSSSPFYIIGLFNCMALAVVLASFLVLSRMWLGAAATLGE